MLDLNEQAHLGDGIYQNMNNFNLGSQVNDFYREKWVFFKENISFCVLICLILLRYLICFYFWKIK